MVSKVPWLSESPLSVVWEVAVSGAPNKKTVKWRRRSDDRVHTGNVFLKTHGSACSLVHYKQLRVMIYIFKVAERRHVPSTR